MSSSPAHPIAPTSTHQVDGPRREAPPGLAGLRAIVCDVQGTCVDFYEPLLRVGRSFEQAKGLALDWAAFSTDWRELYRAALNGVISGREPWRRVDQIYRAALDVLLERRGLSGAFTPSDRDRLNAVWTQLDPWPDTVDGLVRLRRRFVTATLSNAGMAALVALVKHAGLPFDAILSAELARSYKPAPAVYQLAVDYLGFAPGEILLVACHPYDLRAGRAFGLRTAFVARPLEFGPAARPEPAPGAEFDLHVGSFLELADALGC